MVEDPLDGASSDEPGSGASGGDGPQTTHEVTRLLHAWASGDRAAGEALMPRVYDALRQAATRAMRGERNDHTLQPTALAHEAFLRLVGQEASWRNRGHFLALASTMMRRVLLDHARHAGRLKRGGDVVSVALDEAADIVGAAGTGAVSETEKLVELDEAITALARWDRRKADVVMLHLVVGLSVAETAVTLDVSAATVSRDWRFARAWLVDRLRDSTHENGAGQEARRRSSHQE